MHAYLLGNNPDISMAELVSVGLEPYMVVPGIAFSAKEYDIDRLGGSIKRFDNLRKCEPKPIDICEKIAQELSQNPSQKLSTIAINIFRSGGASQNSDFKLIMTVRQELQKALNGKKIRLINNKSTQLSSASSVQNGTYKGKKAFEYALFIDGASSWIGTLGQVQNLRGLSMRDQNRPSRDTFVGMLPPKLALAMVNLAAGDTTKKILDPFCGTGVVLQEAILLGHDALGSDISGEMVKSSSENIKWLEGRLKPKGQLLGITKGDARLHDWRDKFDCIATETYLGEPMRSRPTQQTAIQQAKELTKMQDEFLANVSSQAPAGSSMCIAFPFWVCSDGQIVRSTVVDTQQFKEYNLYHKFADYDSLRYVRNNQSVGRELICLQKGN